MCLGKIVLTRGELQRLTAEAQKHTNCILSIVDTPHGPLVLADYPTLLPPPKYTDTELKALKNVAEELRDIANQYPVMIQPRYKSPPNPDDIRLEHISRLDNLLHLQVWAWHQEDDTK
jgi:hypothetical protein